MSIFYKERKIKTLGKIMRKEYNDPAKVIALDPDTLKPIDYGKQKE